MNCGIRVAVMGVACFLNYVAFSNTSHAFPIAAPGTEGLQVLAGGSGDIVATYQGTSAAFSNDLYLMLDANGNPGDDGNFANDLFIFNNHSSTVGSTVNLGSYPIGVELIFRLHVNNTGDDFFTGPADRNPDARFHARVEGNWMTDITLVSFEDLSGINPQYNDIIPQFNDLSYSLNNAVASIPEPTTFALSAFGMAGLGLRRRRRA